MCHAPHNAGADRAQWGKAPVSSSFVLYGVSEFRFGGGRQPGSVSKVCLSCHDGTVGITDYAGAMGQLRFDVAALELGAPVSIGHPYGVAYGAALVRGDGSMADPDTHPVTIGALNSRSGTVGVGFAGLRQGGMHFVP